LETLEK
jgi:hypothetical protein